MKVLANETKRILAVLLSVAMIFAYVPSTVSAYADNKDVSGNDTTAVEEASTEAVEQSGEDGGEFTNLELEAKDDVAVWFGDPTAAAFAAQVKLYDFERYDDGVSSTAFSRDGAAGNPDTAGSDGHWEKVTIIMDIRLLSSLLQEKP